MSQIMTSTIQQPMMTSSVIMPQQPMMTSSVMMPQQQAAVPNFEYVLPSGGVIAPSGGTDYQSASGSYYFQPNTPFVFYPADQEPKAAAKTDVKVAKKKSTKKKKSCGCC